MVLHEQRTFLNLGLTSQISSPVSTNEDVSEITELESHENFKQHGSAHTHGGYSLSRHIHLRMVPKTKKHLIN